MYRREGGRDIVNKAQDETPKRIYLILIQWYDLKHAAAKVESSQDDMVF